MGHKTKIQLIQRKSSASDQYYINVPAALAEAAELAKGEVAEWIILDKANLLLHRPDAPGSPVALKKTLRYSGNSKDSSPVPPPQ